MADLTKMVEEWWIAKWRKQCPFDTLPTWRLFSAMAEQIEDNTKEIEGNKKEIEKLKTEAKHVALYGKGTNQ
jgi:hypothetical protein